MRRLNKVRGRDGVIRDVSDGYILREGEAQVVDLPWMDAMVHDGRGRPAGQRPGFLYADSATAVAVRETVYAEYRDAISNRWQSQRWQSPQLAKTTSSKPPLVFDSPVAAAHAQYRHDIEQRWRR